VGEEAPDRPWLRAVREAVERLSERFGRPEAVIVFGSWSRSGGGDWSDIDVLVVTDGVEGVNILDRFASLADLRALGLDVFVYSFREVESMARRGNPLVLSALIEGLRVLSSERVEMLAAELSKVYRRVGRMWVRLDTPQGEGQVT